ncbi:Cas10/Cmr2 second palm domain-containing protein [Pseudothermotoga sp.]
MKFLAYDVEHIKKYIFSGKHLKTVIGGSGLVRKFEKDIEEFFKGESDCEIVYNGGGNGLIKLPDEVDRRVVEFIRKKAEDYGLQVNISIVDPSEFEIDTLGFFDRLPEGFGEIGKIMLKTGFALKKENQKLRKSRIIELDADKICEFCGKEEYKEDQYEFDENTGEERRICEKCKKKISFRQPGSESNINYIGEPPKGEEKENTYIAILYADGNSFGTVFEKLNSLEEYRYFSQVINKVVEETSVNVAKKHAGERFAMPILGGDDIFLFLPPSSAISVLVDLYESIKEDLSKIVGEKAKNVDFSFALLVVPSSTPFLIEYEIASELLRKAKMERNEENGGYFVAFQYTSRFEPVRHNTGDRSRKSAMEVGEFLDLCELIKDLKRAGLNQNHMQRLTDIQEQEGSSLEKTINTCYFLLRAIDVKITKHDQSKLVRRYLDVVKRYDFKMFSDLFNFLLDFDGGTFDER